MLAGGWFGYWGVCMTVMPGSWDPVACLASTLALEDGVRSATLFSGIMLLVTTSFRPDWSPLPG